MPNSPDGCPVSVGWRGPARRGAKAVEVGTRVEHCRSLPVAFGHVLQRAGLQ
jgi:hypothetical protein